MSRLISVILLSILMFPLAVLAYLLLFIVFERTFFRHDETALIMAGLGTWAFVAVYWLSLWRASVQWTPARRTLTLLSFVGAGILGVALGMVIAEAIGAPNDEFAISFATLVAPLFWLVATIFIWRETPAERAARLDRSAAAVVCPTCGYNLTGLRGTRCPECGSEFTLDQLLASQPGRAQVELET